MILCVIVCTSCATSVEAPESDAPRRRADTGTTTETGFDVGPEPKPEGDVPSSPDAAPPPPPAEDPDGGAPPPPPADPDGGAAGTCEECMANCDVVCAKTPASCKACDDACSAGPCASMPPPPPPPDGSDPCMCADFCEWDCEFEKDPKACEAECLPWCKAGCSK